MHLLTPRINKTPKKSVFVLFSGGKGVILIGSACEFMCIKGPMSNRDLMCLDWQEVAFLTPRFKAHQTMLRHLLLVVNHAESDGQTWFDRNSALLQVKRSNASICAVPPL